tara:strand:- start:404 stop:979 length:576 start_codon:yes stop_codon:yes gene_type:complete
MRHKYYAKKTVYKGITFDSKLEANYYKYLELIQSGAGFEFEHQYKIDAVVPQQHIQKLEGWSVNKELQLGNFDSAIEQLKILTKDTNGIRLTKTSHIKSFHPIGSCTTWLLYNRSDNEIWTLKRHGSNGDIDLYRSKRVFSYYLDFLLKNNNEYTYVDTKGMKTPIYNLKKKTLDVLYGIKITEVTKVPKI